MKEYIRLLGISASPRRGGNSAFLLEKALKAAATFNAAKVEVERFDFFGKRIFPCIACYECIDNKGECVIKDNFQELRDAWLRADAVLFSVPVFTMSIPGQLKSFFDRLANSLIFNEKNSVKKLKVIGTIAQGMHFAAGQESVIHEIANISILLGCLPLAGRDYDGVRGWTYGKLSRSTYKKRLEMGDEMTSQLIKEAQALVMDLLTVALIIRSGARVHRGMLEKLPDYASLLQRLEEDSCPEKSST